MPTKRVLDSWLKEFVKFPQTPSELSEALMTRGLEIEGFEDRYSALAPFIVGEVQTAERHPNADRLSLCTVFDGTEEHTVVCGAPNVAAGQKIVYAPVGTYIATADFTIERRKIRGTVSEGMICSERELGLGDDHDGIMVLDPSAVPGTPIAQLLGDVLYDIEITANRGDWLSHLGVAREIASLVPQDVVLPIPALTESETPVESATSITIDAPELCPRYMARVIRGVKVGPSPAWVQDRLKKLGVRSINNVVDATSLVMFECGHPLHAFDYNRLIGNRIVVRAARAGEKFTTLDSREHELPEGALMICDAERPVAIAGVMGGENSEIVDDTTDVLLESAWFNPSSIRRTARTLGISTDASFRFERGADIDILRYAVDRATALIHEWAGGEILHGVIDAYPVPHVPVVIELRHERVRTLLGYSIDDAHQQSLLRRLGFDVEAMAEGSARVTVPSWRTDCSQEVDLIEEIARTNGYDAIPLDEHAAMSFSTRVDPMLRLVETSRRFFLDNGCHEMVPPYLTDPEIASATGKPVLLRNALGLETSALRTSLVPTMARTIAHNARHGRRDLRLFEIGRAFRQGREDQGLIPGVMEMQEICVAFNGLADPRAWDLADRQSDLFDLRALLDRWFDRLESDEVAYTPVDEAAWGFGAPALAIHCGGEEVGRIGSVDLAMRERFDLEGDPAVAVVDLERLVGHIFRDRRYVPASRYPVVERDLSILVDAGTPSVKIEGTIRAAGGELLSGVRLFDRYAGKGIDPGKVSLAYALRFTSYDRTLDDETVISAVAAIRDALAREHNAVIRGEAVAA